MQKSGLYIIINKTGKHFGETGVRENSEACIMFSNVSFLI